MSFAHNYLSQLSNGLRDALFGLCDYRAMFRMGVKDSEFLNSDWKHDNTRKLPTELSPRLALVQAGNSFIDPTEMFLGTDPEEKSIMTSAYARRHFARKRAKVETAIERFVGGMKC